MWNGFARCLLVSVVLQLLSGGTETRAGVSGSGTNAVIVCLGDSITKAGYPAELQNLLGVPVVNAGVSGNTTRQGLARLERDVLSLRPKFVVLFFGANDSRLDAPKTQVNLEEYKANLTKIIERSQDVGAKVILGTMPPIVAEAYFQRHPRENYDAVGGFEKHVERYRQAALQVAQHRRVTVVDLNRLLRKHPEWIKPDGVHPTSQGNRIIAQSFAEKIKPLLADKGGATKRLTGPRR